MKYYASFSYDRNTVYIVDDYGRGIDGIIDCLDSIGAPIFLDAVHGYYRYAYYHGETYDDELDRNLTEDEFTEKLLEVGYEIIGDLIVDMVSLELDEAPPDKEIGTYRFPLPGFEQYRTLKRNKLVRVE